MCAPQLLKELDGGELCEICKALHKFKALAGISCFYQGRLV